MKQLFLSAFLLFGVFILSFGKDSQDANNQQLQTIRSSGEVNKSFIPPLRIPEVKNRFTQNTEKEEEGLQLTQFKVTYNREIQEEAKTAIEYALLLWQELITSDIQISVYVTWAPMEEKGILAHARAAQLVIENNVPGMPRHRSPIAIANRTRRIDLRPNFWDIEVTINSNEDFYFGTDGDCPITQIDLVTIMLHEMGHGLGFSASARLDENESDPEGTPARAGFGRPLTQGGPWSIGHLFDYFIEDGIETNLMSSDIYQNPSVEMYNAFVGNNLYFAGPLAKAANNGNHIRLYAPDEWSSSSVSHLNEASFRGQSHNALMTPQVGFGEAVHRPGPLTLAILGDLGWDHVWMNHTAKKDTEDTATSIRIATELASDSPITIEPSLHHKFPGDEEYTSTPMAYDADKDTFYADIMLNDEETDIDYYLQVTGSEDRVFTNPSEAIENPYTIHVGVDTTAPIILHTPKQYLFSTQNKFTLTYQASDNLGLALLQTEIWLDGFPLDPIQYIPQGESDFFTQVHVEKFTEFQTLEYRFVATDSAVAQNKTYLPSEGVFSVGIETIYSATTQYANGFTIDDPGFILDGFTIGLEEGFADVVLGTPHPYSNNGSETRIDYYAIMRQQIQVKEGTTISFDEVVLVEPGEDGVPFGENEFYDYVSLEISKDQGKNWLALDGLDSAADEQWLNLYQGLMLDGNSTATGSAPYFKKRIVSLDSTEQVLPGDVIMIRFHLFSDPFSVGWGWVIDNISVTATLPQ